MAVSVLDRPELRVEPDPATGVWTIALGGRAYQGREWSWGERRRLVDSCMREGSLLRDLFVERFVDLLVSPPPEEDEVPVLAAALLRVLGVDPGAQPASLLAAEAVLAAAWGWGPAQLDPQPASRMDRHVAALSTTPDGDPSGWTTIEVVDG